MNGKFVAWSPGSINLRVFGGEIRQYLLGPGCVLTLNGVDAAWEDLLPDDVVEVEGQPAVAVLALGPARQLKRRPEIHHPAQPSSPEPVPPVQPHPPHEDPKPASHPPQPPRSGLFGRKGR